VEPGDQAGLTALYEGLDDDDRYRRFFFLHRPSAAAIESWASERGDDRWRLVATVIEPDGGEQIVADALGARLPDGDGEFALVVAAGWRGWLGPYLLDALCETAVARGIHNLQADILTENRQMLALARARGYAVTGNADFTQTRVTVSCTGHIPEWPPRTSGRRLLVEAPGGRWSGEATARAAGMSVMICPGPSAHHGRCPALRGERCPLASGADAIFCALQPEDPQREELLTAHATVHPEVPLYVKGIDDPDAAFRPEHRLRRARSMSSMPGRS
jgi:hypothetical protein